MWKYVKGAEMNERVISKSSKCVIARYFVFKSKCMFGGRWVPWKGKLSSAVRALFVEEEGEGGGDKWKGWG